MKQLIPEKHISSACALEWTEGLMDYLKQQNDTFLVIWYYAGQEQ
jgi:hypothetical protein